MHRGHAFSALTAAHAAREAGGRFILRIEDIDVARCRAEFEAAIHEDLAWIGLNWETPVRRQSDHMDDYRAALNRLGAEGLIYRCFKTRSDLMDEAARAPHGPVAPYLGAALPEAEEALRLAAGEPFAWRLSLRAAKDRLGPAFDRLDFVEQGAGPNGEHGQLSGSPQGAGDVILARKGLGVAYHLAVVVDDASQGVNLVVRGADLFDAVPVQRLLQTLLGLPAPVYLHHPILLRPDGKRYAKRDQS
ncbi:MAG TPA: tRNA glutamyl-Q(34) synthetase GluQRS, partial [Caulobacteraceae bacterium]|nr:tRNA glutamyl-Q(34) synthetase GluQRS [Caulobacteraceae bacterium]